MHAVTEWWNGAPIRGGALNRDALKSIFDAVAESAKDPQPATPTTSASPWISVKDRMPKEGVKVLVKDEHGATGIAYYAKDDHGKYVWRDSMENGYSWWPLDVWTHWTSIPERP